MSDDWVFLIPEDPACIPSDARQKKAEEFFRLIAPDACPIELVVSDKVMFFDCGPFLEQILCPVCNAEISIEWWLERMSDDQIDNGGMLPNEFRLFKYVTPCCNKPIALHELKYDPTQGFARFAIQAMNPNIGELDDKCKSDFEIILGTRLRVIYCHV